MGLVDLRNAATRGPAPARCVGKLDLGPGASRGRSVPPRARAPRHGAHAPNRVRARGAGAARGPDRRVDLAARSGGSVPRAVRLRLSPTRDGVRRSRLCRCGSHRDAASSGRTRTCRRVAVAPAHPDRRRPRGRRGSPVRRERCDRPRVRARVPAELDRAQDRVLRGSGFLPSWDDFLKKLNQDALLGVLVLAAIVYLVFVAAGYRGRNTAFAIAFVVTAVMHIAFVDIGWWERYQAYLVAAGLLLALLVIQETVAEHWREAALVGLTIVIGAVLGHAPVAGRLGSGGDEQHVSPAVPGRPLPRAELPGTAGRGPRPRVRGVSSRRPGARPLRTRLTRCARPVAWARSRHHRPSHPHV